MLMDTSLMHLSLLLCSGLQVVIVWSSTVVAVCVAHIDWPYRLRRWILSWGTQSLLFEVLRSYTKMYEGLVFGRGRRGDEGRNVQIGKNERKRTDVIEKTRRKEE